LTLLRPGSSVAPARR